MERDDKVKTVKRKGKKRQTQNDAIPNPLLVDEKAFTDVVDKMLHTGPVTLEGVKAERRRNPKTDPRYLPVFDFSNRPGLDKAKQPKAKK